MIQSRNVLGNFLVVMMTVTVSLTALGDQGQGESTEPNNNNSINNNANQGQSSSSSAAGMNSVIGAGMIAAGVAMLAPKPPNPYGYVLIALGGLALAQAGADRGAAGHYGNVAGLTNTAIPGSFTNGVNGGGKGSTGATTLGPGGLTNSELASLAKAEEKGFKFDMKNGKLTTPDGKEIPFSDINSGAAASSGSAGFTAGNLAKAKKHANKLAKDAMAKYNVGTMGFDKGGGGGSAGYGGGEDGTAEDPLAAYLKSLNKKKGRKPASVAGMKRRFGNDYIGVSADNIFKMIHRRYKKKRDAKEFIEGPVRRRGL